MNNFVWYWNLVHYYIIKLSDFGFLVFGLPFYYGLNSSKNLFNFLVKIGGNPTPFLQRMENRFNKKTYFSDRIKTMGFLLILFEWSLFNYCQLIFNEVDFIGVLLHNKTYLIIFLVLAIAVPILINYLTLFKNEKFLKYCHYFEEFSIKQHRSHSLIAFSIVIFILIIFFISIYLFGENLKAIKSA